MRALRLLAAILQMGALVGCHSRKLSATGILPGIKKDSGQAGMTNMTILMVFLVILFMISACGKTGGTEIVDNGQTTVITDVGNVEGTVTSAITNTPISGVTVSIGNKFGVTTDSGNYIVENVPVGSRTITASKSGYKTGSGSVEVQKGITVTYDMQMSPDESASGDLGNVEGTVKEQGTSIMVSAATVQIGDKTGLTQGSGYYSINGVGIGDRIIMASKAGYQTYTGTVSVQKGMTVVHNIDLTKGSTTDTLPPSVPAGLTAIAVSSDRIDIIFNPSTDNVKAEGYKVYRSGSEIATSAITSYSDKGLTASTQYCYTVSAYDAAGNMSAKSAQACATTMAVTDTTAPSVPANLIANAVSSSGINLTWTASAESDVSGYKVYRDGAQITTATVAAYSDSGLMGSTQYCYQVSSIDTAGNESAKGSQSCATTQPSADVTPPSVPTGLVATVMSSSQIDLSWTASTDPSTGSGQASGVAGYKVYRGGGYIKSSTTNSASDFGLTANTQYCYMVSAYDAAGNESAKSAQSCATTMAVTDTTAPSAPTNLSANTVSSSGINLIWSVSPESDVYGYKIYRGGAYVTTVIMTSYSDIGLMGNTQYCYQVSAIDGVGNESVKGSQSCATTQQSADTTPPSVPTGLVATAMSSSQIDLTWTASSDNTGVAGYKVYRDGAYIKSSTANSASDFGLSASTQYCYTVTAYDAAGNESGVSGEACGTTMATGTITLASGLSYPHGIAVDSNSVYWTERIPSSGTVKKVSINGGNALTLASGQYQPSFLAVDSASVFWTNYNTNVNPCCSPFAGDAIGKVGISGDAISYLVSSGTVQAHNIAIGTDNVYWAENRGGVYGLGDIYKISKTGGAVTLLASGQSCVTGLAVDSTSIYWEESHNCGGGADMTGIGNIKKSGINGGTIITLATGLKTSEGGIAIDSTHIYWADYGNGAIKKVAKDGTGETPLASGLSGPRNIAIDATDVYWIEGNSIQKVGINGGAITSMATGLNSPAFITLDTTTVYWTEFGSSGAIKKMLK